MADIIHQAIMLLALYCAGLWTGFTLTKRGDDDV